ncbi:hypothetical protein [Methylacidimicrobium tartarophylax]|uniref:hypothetical protein n=1 Tax=Methylacidimicrobium tartarophylax TaxID=1041768 RepID=UPI0011596A81|nr:hypothetical protein [Methylacidimicrobium tartarophylax]
MKKKTGSGNRLSWMVRQALVLLPIFGLGLGRAVATVGLIQLPGHGSVVGGSATYTSSAPGVGTVANGAARTVINWGSTGGSLNVSNSGTGFNIGSSAILNFTGHAGAVLNVDTSGNPSKPAGDLELGQQHPDFCHQRQRDHRRIDRRDQRAGGAGSGGGDGQRFELGRRFSIGD